MKTENFRADIQRLIESKEMTQLKLSKLSGVPQSTLSMFLNGENKELVSRHVFALWPFVYGNKCENCDK